MKIRKAAFSATVALLLGFSGSASPAQTSEKATSTTQAPSVRPFLGRWDLTLKAPGHEYPSWIEIQEKDGQVSALFTSRWGNARPLPKIEIKGTHITFVSPKEEEDRKDDMVFEGTLEGNGLAGTTTGQDGTPWRWSGVRASSLSKKSVTGWGQPVDLLNGKDLSGWKMSQSGPQTWTVRDGNLVSPGNGPELISTLKFQDFKLHVEFNCGKNANSGVYLRGRYEVQIETESEAEPPSHHTGGIYGFLKPEPELPRTPDTWQTFDIMLIGRHVTIVQNGQVILNNKEIPGITGGALDSHESQPGPIYLQGSEKGHVAFRKIVVTPAQ